MSNEVPQIIGHPAPGTDMVQVAFAPGAIYDAFQAWVRSQGLELTPPMRFTEDEEEIPTRFVVLTNETAVHIWSDAPEAQIEVSKLGQPDG